MYSHDTPLCQHLCRRLVLIPYQQENASSAQFPIWITIIAFTALVVINPALDEETLHLVLDRSDLAHQVTSLVGSD